MPVPRLTRPPTHGRSLAGQDTEVAEVNFPLIVAVLAALLGFGLPIWLMGPGTSVPIALLALLCALILGRAGWWLAARGEAKAEETLPEPSSQARSPPPRDPAPWRAPEEGS